MTFHDTPSRTILCIGALVGALGVITAAAATHTGDTVFLGSASTISLAHGPVLVALGLFGLRSRALMVAAVLLTLGTLLFCGDLLARHQWGTALFPMAAPIGGGVMILGWIGLAIAAWVGRR